MLAINLESCVNITDKSLKNVADGCPVWQIEFVAFIVHHHRMNGFYLIISFYLESYGNKYIVVRLNN